MSEFWSYSVLCILLLREIRVQGAIVVTHTPRRWRSLNGAGASPPSFREFEATNRWTWLILMCNLGSFNFVCSRNVSQSPITPLSRRTRHRPVTSAANKTAPLYSCRTSSSVSHKSNQLKEKSWVCPQTLCVCADVLHQPCCVSRFKFRPVRTYDKITTYL
jgi:hypothetical protein